MVGSRVWSLASGSGVWSWADSWVWFLEAGCRTY